MRKRGNETSERVKERERERRLHRNNDVKRARVFAYLACGLRVVKNREKDKNVLQTWIK